MYVVVKPPEHLACIQEEIFGPVTPVLTYRSMDEVYDRINVGRDAACGLHRDPR